MFGIILSLPFRLLNILQVMNFDEISVKIRKLIRYIEARIVLRNFVLAFLILVFGTVFIMQILKIYTRHNHDLTVPDFA